MNEELSVGKYYIGDPSFVLHDKITVGIWENEYKCKNGKFTIFGYECIFQSIHKNNCSFIDTNNNKYTIETGILSCIPIELIEKDKLHLCNHYGYIYEFNEPLKFIYLSGLFYIKSKNILIKFNHENNEKEYCSDNEGYYSDYDTNKNLISFLDEKLKNTDNLDDNLDDIHDDNIHDDDIYDDDIHDIDDNNIVKKKNKFF